MLKRVCFKVSSPADCRKRKWVSALLDWSRIKLGQLKIAGIEFYRIFKIGPSPQKCLGFHFNFFTYKRETLAMFFRILEDLCVTLCEIWEVLYLLITQESTRARSTMKYRQNIVAASRSLLMGIWNLWVGSQSHKQVCLCWCKLEKRRSLWIRSLHMVMSVSYYMR